MQVLYPDLRTYAEHSLKVDDVHTLYVEESGAADGIPVLFIHGGPGAGSSKYNRRFFDPDAYRIILYDQRGAGRSTPHAELRNNTTEHLIADIEAIREFLGIEQWLIFGGSWGATLGLLYAQSHPNRVLSLILRGVFLCRQQDLDWFYRAGADRIFPDYWHEFVSTIPQEERGDLIQAYYDRLTGSNELAKMGAAKAWSTWEGHCSTLRPNPDIVHDFADPHFALALACIETHYFINKCFIQPNQIIENADKLAGIPGVIVHGRYDIVCPLDNATALHEAWPDSELHIIRDAGHSSHEPSIIDALIKATNDMAKVFGEDFDRKG